MFLTKLLSKPRFLTCSSNSLSLALDSIIMSNLFYKAAYWIINSLMFSYFYASCCLKLSTSFYLLLILSSKYYLILISWVPKKAFILDLSSSIAALDSSWKFSINPLESPSYCASDEFMSWRCSYCFFILIWFF